ncbi:MAG TPA: phosphatase PAP2 family protein [Burkholderiales bacterium]|nr:phosphatase PAP2 family protein [Burkholderiales bacterium]
MKRLAAAIVLAVIAPAGQADVIFDWNDVAFQALRADPMGPTFGSRSLAIVHAAMYDAVNSVTRQYQPYALDIVAAPGTSQVAAAAQAAHDALLGLYPSQQPLFDARLAASLSGIADGAEKTAGITLGQQAANAILTLRAGDHANDPVPYSPGTLPGQWQPDPLNPSQTALSPGWGNVTPFTLSSAGQFRPPAPPDLSSQAYTDAFIQVKSLGEKNSAARTSDQTQTAIFWAYDVGGVGPPSILYNQITQVIAAQQGNTLEQNARLFALINLAQADAGIATWEAKYIYNFWRPVNAIRATASYADGNPGTIEDPLWIPLGAPGDGLAPDFTPPFPAYTSGHAAFGAATFRTLADFYGTDSMDFVLHSDEFDIVRGTPVERAYSSFSQAAEENALSRIYLGIHWAFDASEGIALGKSVADWVFANALSAVPVPGTMLLFAAGLAAIALRRRQIPSARTFPPRKLDCP